MNLVFRVDASTTIGTGHLMRCLALAQAWQDRGKQPIFLMATEALILEARLKSEGMEVVNLQAQPGSAKDAKETASLAHQMEATWVAVDGYHFGSEYQRIIKDAGLHLLFIDDYRHADHYYADIVLNQNVYAREGLYINRQPYTHLLLGTRYALLRREFLQWRGWQRSHPMVATKLLVTMGGSDPDNVSLKVIQALQLVKVGNLEVVVVVGGSNPHYEQLLSASRESNFPISISKNVTNMPELMAWADIAVVAGGTTSWELAFMGLPSIMMILAENQRASAEQLHAMLVASNLGWHEDVSAADIASAIARLLIDTETRIEMARHCQKLVDGEGSNIVLKYLENHCLKLRMVSEEDCRLLWEWANDPKVRIFSFSSKSIPWEDHVQWFKSTLNKPNSILYIATDINDAPIGQIRYDLNNHEAVISVSIDRKFRHQGYGSSLISLATQKLFNASGINRINAYIKTSNQASIRAFLTAGFQEMGTITLYGEQAFHFILDRYKK